MGKKLLSLFIISILSLSSFAQMPMGGMGGGGGAASKIGHFYGKVIDSITGKAVPYAVVELMGTKWDSVSKTRKPAVIAGQVCGANGEFSLENLPIMGKMTLKITFIGYQDYTVPVSFNIDFSKIKKTAGGTPDYSAMINMVDKDLGNIHIKPSATQLQQVTIQASAPAFQLQVDKKIYNVDKDITSTGGTAQDVLKNVPSVNVDVDGNVTMRNATPQILVDGMPTTLTMDEIPADAIQNIEVITNPSAKYDASGGGGGIINIVMKKDRKAGYSGNLRAGVDERGRVNGGGNINVRQGKVNFFANAFLNQRKSMAYTSTDRYNLIGNPLTNIYQNDTATNLGEFGFVNAGFDFFPDVRNTITVSENYVHGSFNPSDFMTTLTDSVETGKTPFSSYDRTTVESTTFRNWTTNLSYKHLFPKESETFTLAANGSFIKNSSDNNFYTQYFNMLEAATGPQEYQYENESGTTDIYTVQADFSDPLKKGMKIETGVRSSIRNYSSIDDNYLQNDSTDQFVYLASASNQYTYTDAVYAAYFTFSQQIKKFSYQAGLREESSFYTGDLIDSNMTFKNYYPAELFPSAFASYQLTKNDELQLNYSRRVNRPTFFELIPYTNYTDSLNLTRGNPDLKPEFVNNVEFNYSHNLNYTDIILFSLFLHQTDNLITNYQIPVTYVNESYILNTYENANSGLSYGLEITLSNTIGKWLTILTDVNGYNSQINATNLNEGLVNNQFSYNARVSPTIKFPKNFTLQITAMYQSQSSLPVSLSGSSNGPGGGGGGFFGGPTSTVQGYTKPFEYVDVAIKKEFLKTKALAVTLTCTDIFKTRINATYSDTQFFIQDYSRIRDPQFFKLNISYRFGKVDPNLFKRKVIQNPSDQMQDMPQQ